MTEMLEGLSDTDASSMLAMMDPDDAADLIDELDYEKAEKLLRLMGVQEEKAIRNLLGYEDNTAGRIMTSEFVSLPATATVGDAIEAIRKLDEDFESVYYVYTEDPSGMLTGVLSLRTLIVADRDATLGQLAYRDLVYVSPDDDQEDVTDEMTKYDLVAIPVCDENRHILGIVTFDDAMDVIAEEHQEDLQIAGVGSGDSASDDSTNVLSWFGASPVLGCRVGYCLVHHGNSAGDGAGLCASGGVPHVRHAARAAGCLAYGVVRQELLPGVRRP